MPFKMVMTSLPPVTEWRRETAMSAPDLQLRTLYVLNGEGRILSTREPEPASPAPVFAIIRSASSCAWAVRADVPDDLAAELDNIAREESPASDLRDPPKYAERYISLVGGCVCSGPAFTFPEQTTQPAGVVAIEDEHLLERNFRGWVPGEIAAGRSPVVAVIEDGYPVSICFCARRTDFAAEAGLETAEAFRGRGYGPRATAAWALAVRASGRTPLYSTSWINAASLSVARKLGLVPYASDWSLS